MPKKKQNPSAEFQKSRTGINGFDEITFGGLPAGRPTLVCGTAGCGKSLFAMEFIVNGAQEFGEPGVFMTFEERTGDIERNFASLGYDLESLQKKKKLVIDYVHIDRNEIEENGEFDLEGLFVRLGHAIDSVGAKRVALDTIEALFSGFTNAMMLRAELQRLFRWLKDRGVTTVVTGESGREGQLTRQGMEEYVSDGVIFLDHRIQDQVSTRRLRVVKYRGSAHGTNEYPFIIDEEGISVMPITSLELNHAAPKGRLSTGVPGLDTMLEGKGYFRGSSVLITGTPGSGKTSLAAHFVDAVCRRGEKCYYFAFEESIAQLLRNMRSIGVDLEPWIKKGLLRYHTARPTLYGLEAHLAKMHQLVTVHKPSTVVLDPVSNLISVGSPGDVKSMLMRMVDYLKVHEITALFTSLADYDQRSITDLGFSSLMDTLIMLRDVEADGEFTRVLAILKSRGMAHSNQVREFMITGKGIRLVDVYRGAQGVLRGSARMAQISKETVIPNGSSRRGA